MDSTLFTESEFRTNLRDHLSEVMGDPAETSGEFLSFCGPIIFGDFDLYEGVSKLPHPFADYMFVYQAWGLISSDGFECYLESTDSRFDSKVDSGLELLGFRKPRGILRKARLCLRLFGSRTGMLPKVIERYLWKRFYDPLEELERELLGPSLLQTLFLKNKP